MRPFPLFLLALAVIASCSAQRPTVKKKKAAREGDPRWVKVDSLTEQGLYDSALQLVTAIGTDARAKNDWRTEFRSWAVQSAYRSMIGQEQDTVIGLIEQRIADAALGEVPLPQLLHSQLASLYWSAYQQDRWQILERTNVDGGLDNADRTTWDQRTYMAKVIAHFQASLEPADSLWQVPTKDLGPLLDGDERSMVYRPALFDLLAHRALEVFGNSETRLAEPAWRFQLSDPRTFALFEGFAYGDFTQRDSTSWEFQALRLYQQLTRHHLSDDQPDALVDLELGRLRYMQQHSTHPRKDTLHLEALEKLRTRLPKDSCWAEVTTALAQWHADQAGNYQRLAGDRWKTERRTAVQLCDEAITKYPKSYGAKNAIALKAQLEQPALRVTSEEAVLPNAAFKVALDHANVKQVWLRVVKGPSANSWDEERVQKLVKLPSVLQWNVTLPDDGDLNEHRVELPVEGLPPGRYTLLTSNEATFTFKKSLVVATSFQCTELAATQREVPKGEEVLVVHRGTGAPLSDANVTMQVRRWSGGTEHWDVVKEDRTDADGIAVFAHGEQSEQYRWLVKALGQEMITGNRYFGQSSNESEIAEEPRTFLFLDRGIYRPGQPIQFKGIVTIKRDKAVEVMANYSTVVRFFDVNSELVDTLAVTTDAYGSFHGTFTAPKGVLTGQMRLEEQHGSAWFRVEEYKRPTFEVVFDPISATPKLGQEAEATGVAKSYAGVPLDNAQVQWTVKRSARMPWWCGWGWRGFPGWGTETEVASGTATTDAQGKFSVKFKAEADAALPREADPTFSFNVEASVTDINGETQLGSTSLSVGHRSIDIDVQLGEAIDRSRTDSLVVRVQNLNGEPVDVPMDVRIHRLTAPPVPLRDRLWERPDRFVLTAEEHAKRFPGEVYANEMDPLAWPVASTMQEQLMWKAQGRALRLVGVKDWTVGSYLVEVSAKDADGKELKVRKAFTVFDPEIQNTGFVTEAFHAEGVKLIAEPGEKAVFLLSTALPEARVLMEVERDGAIAVRRWFTLKNGQQRVELPVMEDDRGGFTVHLLCVERDRSHQEALFIDVPWTNKQLKVEWMTFRDKLLPGAKEEWRLKLSGPKGEVVAAQLLTAMYDASLDVFAANYWDMSIWSQNYAQRAWAQMQVFGQSSSDRLWNGAELPSGAQRMYPSVRYLDAYAYEGRYRLSRGYADGGVAFSPSPRGAIETVQFAVADEALAEGLDVGNANGTYTFSFTDSNGVTADAKAKPEALDQRTAATGQQPIRSDFRETAFFFPDLLTDRDGSVVLRFTMPDALTRWKVLGFAHTTDLKTAQFTRETITQKPLMVVPNLPRFLRAGDRITLTAKINALEQRIEGPATLALFDPFTNASMDKVFGLKTPQQVFVAAPGESGVVEWSITVPEGVDAVAVRITAQGGGGPIGGSIASDGEERVLPVLTDKLLVTESLPLAVTKAGTKTFTLEKLKRSGGSSTLEHKGLTLEFTPNPAWYAVQALPYLMEFPHECAEQTFSRYYANRLAAHIVEQRPAIKQVFEQWKAKGPDSFMSALEKNPELKSIVLAETPWVLDAKDDRQRKERIALLFDLERMGGEEKAALKKLKEMQLPNGAWPWWSGMGESRYITEHIVAGLGHLEQLGAADLREDGEVNAMLKKAVRWLDQDLEREYRELKKHLTTEQEKNYRPGSDAVHWLYARSFHKHWYIDGATAPAFRFYRDRLAATWLDHGLQEQAMLALVFQRFDMIDGHRILKSLKERATVSEELGMYWKNFNGGSDWWSFPAETHALMIEAFHEVAKDADAVNSLRQYLLKLKQTTDWKTTKATADACYALLLTGDDWLVEKAMPTIILGNVTLSPSKGTPGVEAGTGHFEQRWSGPEVKPNMSEVSVTTTRDGVQWGALHWQYLERMDKVTPHESPFSIKKQVLLTEQTDVGPKLVALNGPRALKVGDLITIRMELRTDRYLDYVHLKDLRAASLEPTEALSGYQYQGGLGYYQSIRDASMNFFFDRIAPGTYVFEYTLRVTHSGDFSNGITTAQCMYAPEFSSHSEGVRVKVAE